jgi:hypothetical protein
MMTAVVSVTRHGYGGGVIKFAADQSRELAAGPEQYVPVRNIALASLWAFPTAESNTTNRKVIK